jgi:hypothetical protein
MGDQSHAAAVYPLNRCGTHFKRGWVGLRAGLNGYGKFALTRIWNPSRQVCSQPLHRIGYRRWSFSKIHTKYVNEFFGNDVGYFNIGQGVCTDQGVKWFNLHSCRWTETHIPDRGFSYPDWGFSILRFSYPEWGFSYPDWGFSTLTEVFLPWMRFFLPWLRFFYPDWGFPTLTEVFLPWMKFFLPWLRFFYPDWGFSVLFPQF